MGEKKASCFRLENVLDFFFTSSLIKEHEKSQKLGSIPLEVQNYAEKARHKAQNLQEWVYYAVYYDAIFRIEDPSAK